MDAIIWPVNASLSSVINVEEFTWSVNAWKNSEECRRGEELKLKKEEGKKLRRDLKQLEK